MSKSVCVLALATILGSSGCERPTAEPATASRPSEMNFEVEFSSGDVTDYAFSWSVDGTAQQPLLASATATGGVRLRGVLQVRVYPSPDENVWLGLTLTSLDEARLHVLGQNVLPAQGAPLLGVETVLVVPPDADPSTLLLPPDAPAVLRHVMPGLLAHVDLVPGRRDSSPNATARTPHGIAHVSYGRAARSLTRTTEDYARLDAVPGDVAGSTRVEGESVVDFDAAGRLERVDSVELVATVGAEAVLGMEARSEFTLRRTQTVHEDPRPLPDVEPWTVTRLDAPPDASAIERELARKFAEGMTGEDLEALVSAAGAGLKPSKGALVRVRGLLRGWPEVADELREPYAAAPDTRTRGFILDLLLSANTPASLHVVTEVLDPSDPDGDLPELLQHVALTQTPTPQLGQFLLTVSDTATEADDALLRRASFSAIGTVCDGLTETEPALAERLHGVLLRALDVATGPRDVETALAGLANAGRPLGRAHAMRHRFDDDVDVRAQVASSLREASGPAQRDAVFAMLADPHRHVAGSALAVIDHYFDDDAATQTLAARVVAGLYRPDLGPPLAGVISKRGDDNPLTREALRSILARTEDPATRRRLRRVLRDDDA